MAKYQTIRTPSPGELWRQGTFYYIVQTDSNFRKLLFDPRGIADPPTLQHRIQQTCLTKITCSGSTVYHGQDGWICIADNWVDYVIGEFQLVVENFKSALTYCEVALSRSLFIGRANN